MKALQLKLSFFLFAIVLLCICNSCDFPEHYFDEKPECHNSNDYFNAVDSKSPEYQAKALELLHQQKPEDYRYFFKTFIEENENTYMLTNFRSKDHCFDVKILVDKWDKLAGMRRTNGKSYPNELYDLKWNISTLNGLEYVYYVNMHDIID